jgi:hypothetical protein
MRGSIARALAAGQLVGIAIAELLQLHQRQQLLGPGADRLGLRPGLARPDLQAEADIVQHAHVPEQGVVLEHEADLAVADIDRRHVGAADPQAAGIGMLQPGDDAQQGRLARAGGAEQGAEMPRLDVEADPRQGAELLKPLLDPAKLDAHRLCLLLL